jgi:hypothetical protein
VAARAAAAVRAALKAVVAGTNIEVISQAGSEEVLFAAFAGVKMEPTTGAIFV